MATKRSDFFTVETKKVEYYSDFMNNLEKNPLTGYLAKLSNEESVGQSIKNLILTQRTERPFQPYIGSKVHALLFENNDPFTMSVLEDEIRTTIKNYEPRVNVEAIRTATTDLNEVMIVIVYSLKTLPERFYNVNVLLRRVR